MGNFPYLCGGRRRRRRKGRTADFFFFGRRKKDGHKTDSKRRFFFEKKIFDKHACRKGRNLLRFQKSWIFFAQTHSRAPPRKRRKKFQPRPRAYFPPVVEVKTKAWNERVPPLLLQHTYTHMLFARKGKHECKKKFFSFLHIREHGVWAHENRSFRTRPLFPSWNLRRIKIWGLEESWVGTPQRKWRGEKNKDVYWSS